MFGGFGFFEFMFFIVFILVLSVFIFTAVKGISQWNKNNHSPRLTVNASAVSKRTNVSHHHHGGEAPMTTSSTTYYVTFQFDSGDRQEFRVTGKEYGMIAEGDFGLLSFQGTRFLSFERK